MDAGILNQTVSVGGIITPPQVHRIIAGLLIFLTSVSGVLGNLLVIIAVVVSKKLRTTTNVFVVNLAVADMLTCIFLPFLSMSLFINVELPVPGPLCAVAIGMVYSCLCCSLYTLSSIALNRLLIITRPNYTYLRLFNPKVITIWISLIWVVSFLVTFLPPIVDVGALGYDPDYHICGGLSSHPRTATYESILVLGLYPIPLLTIVVCYLWLYVHIRFHSSKMRKSSIRSLKESSSSGPTPVEEKSRNDVKSPETLSPTTNNRFQFPKLSSSSFSKISKLHRSDSVITPASSPTEKSESGVFVPDLTANEVFNGKAENNGKPTKNGKEQPTLRLIRKTTKKKISRRQVEITKNLFYVVCAFVLCLTPYFLCFLTNCKNYWVLYAATCIFFNSCINPAVYATKHPHFKTVFKCIITRNWKEIPEPADFLRSVSNVFK